MSASIPPNVSLTRFDTPSDLADAAAESWHQWLRTPPKSSTASGSTGSQETGKRCVALSGGRITRDFFNRVTRLLKNEGESETAFQGVHFFWADERCVGPEDPESNFRMARELLFDPNQIDERWVHRIHGEDDPAKAAHQAVMDLRQVTRQAHPEPAGTADHVPQLDLVFLGMGEDGHVASLFPDGLSHLDEADLFYPVTATKPPPHRVTMSYRLLEAAREVVVLISGEGKEEALHQALEAAQGQHQTGQMDEGTATPLGRLLGLRQKTTLMACV